MPELTRVMMFSPSKLNFAVKGEDGAIHFWVPWFSVVISGTERDKYGGVEQHSKTQMYKEQTPMKDCWLLDGDCFCDGSSLYAEEVYIPLFNSCNRTGDFEPLFQMLEREYTSRFVHEKENK